MQARGANTTILVEQISAVAAAKSVLRASHRHDDERRDVATYRCCGPNGNALRSRRPRRIGSSNGLLQAGAARTRTCVRDLARLGLHSLSALATGITKVIEAATAELPNVGVDDALAILVVLAQTSDPRVDRAASHWVGRLLTETPAGLGDARFALALVERLPSCQKALHELARRR
ncbi:MAG: hypothetical protein QOI48_3037 [Solirubrobacteraceae bacterium]|nr:hypothetical protein [Solirubrobacteraceae bacterium]